MNTSDIDIAFNYLQQKICPQHRTKMVGRKPLIIPGGYRRNRYGCQYCGCVVDFVGDEIKSDSVGRSLVVLEQTGCPAYEPDFMD